MRYRLIIRPEAEAELQDAADWYERRVSGLNEKFLAAVDVAVTSIIDNPLQYPVIYKDSRRALVRGFPYQIFFVLAEDVIGIVAVFHGARDPNRWQDRT
jgi:plasmid stabilization system protein ParE